MACDDSGDIQIIDMVHTHFLVFLFFLAVLAIFAADSLLLPWRRRAWYLFHQALLRPCPGILFLPQSSNLGLEDV